MSQIECSEVGWAYTAGFFDGDGTLYLPRQRNEAFRVEFSQRSTEDWVLIEIQDFLAKEGIDSKLYKWKTMGGFQSVLKVFRRDDVIRCLISLAPYVIVKREILLKAMTMMEERVPDAFAEAVS